MEDIEVINLLKSAFELKRQAKYKHAMELLYKALAICPENSEILSQIAHIHMLLDNPQSAGVIYERLAEKQVDNIDVMENLCSYYMSIHNYDKAKLLLEKFVLAYPSQKAYEIYLKTYNSLNLLEKICEIYQEKKLETYHSIEIEKIYAITLFKLGKIEETENLIKNLADKAPYDDEIQYYYAQTLYNLGKQNDAYKIIKPIVNSFGNPKLYNLMGEIELDKQKFEKAINLFIQATKLRADGKYYYNLASAYFLNGQLEEAKGYYLKAISFSPEIEEYRYSLAYLFYKQGNLKKSKQIVDELLKQNPDSQDAIFLCVNILLDEQKYFIAEKILSTYKGERLNSEEFLKLSAMTNKALYRLDAAQENYETLSLLRPNNMDYKLDLARLYFDRQQYSKSAKLVVSIISESPRYINAYILAAKIYIKMYDFDNVVKMAQKILALDLNNEEAFYLKALGQIGLFQIDEAIETAKQLLDYNPHKSEAYALIGAAYMEKCENEIAEKYYQEAIQVNSKNADYFINLALLQEKLGKEKEAIRHLFIANRLSPDNKIINSKLVELYIKQKQYKNAMKLIYNQLNSSTKKELKTELKSQLKEIELLYKKNNGFAKHLIWLIFKI